MIRSDVILRHAEDAAFLWTQRERMLQGQRHTHVERMRADSRLEGHLDGLVHARAYGLECVLERFESYGGPGEVFAATVVAHALSNDPAIERVLAQAAPSAASRKAMIAASAWQPFAHVSSRFGRWAVSAEPRLRRLAVGGLAVHRAQDDGWVARALLDEDIMVRRRGARAVGELGALEHVNRLRLILREHPPLAIAAALALARLGERSAEVRAVLIDALLIERPIAEAAARALARIAPSEAMDIALQSGSCADARLLGMAAVEALGDTTNVPALLSWMDDSKLARRAGQAFSTITGADLVSERLCDEPRADADGDDAFFTSDEERDLPMPSRWKVMRWWQDNGERFLPGMSYLEGEAVGLVGSCLRCNAAESLRRVAMRGRPRHRAMAARILAEHAPAMPVIETRAPATRMHQQPGLQPWLQLTLPIDSSNLERA